MKSKISLILLSLFVIVLFMGTVSAADLNITTGSWNTLGLDSNNVNNGPNLYIIQTHVKNNGSTTAKNISGTITFQNSPPGSSYINLKTGENTTKNLGDIAPGETKDLYYQIEVTRDSNAYGTSRNYIIELFENGISTGTISGTLSVVPKNSGLIEQNRNTIESISASTISPQIGDIFTVTVHAHTSSAGYDFVELPLIQYDPTKIQPVGYSVQYGSSTSNSLLLTNPGTTEFTSTWTLKALEAGSTPVIPFIVDKANNAENYHYNRDFGEDQLTINVLDKCVDLAVTKTDSPDPVTAGNQLTYTITVTNNGPSNINGFTLVDTLPAGFTNPVYTPSAGSYDSATGAWTGLNLASGQSVTLTITGTVGPGVTGTLTNTVTVSPPEGVTDPNQGNNQATATTTVNCQSNLVVTKLGSPDPVIAGNLLTYAMSITNNGPSVAHILTFRDTLPAALTSVQYSLDNINWYSYTSGQEVGLGNLNVGQTVNFWIRGTVNPATMSGTISNTVTAYINGIANNQATATTTVNRQADLHVVKTRTSSSPAAGEAVTYQITVTNQGPSTINGFTLTDTTSPSLIGLTYGTPSAGSYDSATGAWTGLNLASGQSVTITLTGTVPASATGNLVNTATVAPPDGVTDPDPSDNTFAVTDTINRVADLAVTKTDSPDPVTAGNQLTYTITVTNNGPSNINGFTLVDTLPAGFTNPVYTPSAGSYDSATGAWTGLNLASGQSVTLTITGTVGPGVTGTLTNTVTVSPPEGVTDPNQGNNQATATTSVINQSPLTVDKSGPATVIAGNEITYTMTVYNNGPSIAHDVSFIDTLPTALTNAEYSLNNVNWFAYTGQLVNLGDINPLTTVTFYIRGIVDPSTTTALHNVVTVYKCETPSGEDCVDTTVTRQADLSVTKIDTPDPVKTGQTLTYTITVTNNGPSTLDQFALLDNLPTGFTATSWTPSAGSYDPATGAWTGLNLASGQSVTLTITGTVNPGTTGTLTNTVTVSPPEGVTDPNTANNQATATTTVNREADLVLTKTVDNSSPKVKDTIHFTMIVNNLGPDTAVDVQVADKLPAGLNFVSYTANYGTYDPETGIWSIGNLPNGASAVITITSVVENSGTIINEAKVTSLTYDPNLEGNTATATVNVQQPVVHEVDAASDTVPMQPTGIPFVGIVLAILLLTAGIVMPKRK